MPPLAPYRSVFSSRIHQTAMMDKWQQDYRMKHHKKRMKRIRREVSTIDHYHSAKQDRPSPPKNKKKRKKKQWLEWQLDNRLIDSDIQRAREGRAGWVFANNPNDLSYLVCMSNIENNNSTKEESSGLILRSATTSKTPWGTNTTTNTTSTTSSGRIIPFCPTRTSRTTPFFPSPPTKKSRRRRRRCRKNRDQRLVLSPRTSSLLSENTTTTTICPTTTDMLSANFIVSTKLSKEADNILRLEEKLDRYTRDARRRRRGEKKTCSSSKNNSKFVPLPTPPFVRRRRLRDALLPVL